MAGYGTDEGFDAWLAENGYELAENLEKAVVRQRGSAYIDGLYGSRFPGVPTDGLDQERAWPRRGATAYGDDIDEDAIPANVVKASYVAAYYEDQNPDSLAASTSGGAVKRTREKIAVIETETEYFDRGGDAVTAVTVVLSEVEGLLRPFIGSSQPAIFGSTVRG